MEQPSAHGPGTPGGTAAAAAAPSPGLDPASLSPSVSNPRAGHAAIPPATGMGGTAPRCPLNGEGLLHPQPHGKAGGGACQPKGPLQSLWLLQSSPDGHILAPPAAFIQDELTTLQDKRLLQPLVHLSTLQPTLVAGTGGTVPRSNHTNPKHVGRGRTEGSWCQLGAGQSRNKGVIQCSSQ